MEGVDHRGIGWTSREVLCGNKVQANFAAQTKQEARFKRSMSGYKSQSA